ncbi:PREDICTED: uncharacterized protein LOC108781722, partial [Cyphomyrmex costatus]|uniref:uncharacterized protein LOC108781722 n=1 Tax=Cyphomyrmex costatus TaxID=456900 RepID=UPI00085227A0
MYMKSKPDKYGLKIVTLNDAATSYLINGIPYLGKTRIIAREESICEYFFRSVTTPIHGSGRTAICDNWFTTISLVQRMLQPEFDMTVTGTLRKNKREIPKQMIVAAKDPPKSTFCFTKNMTLVSYSPKKNKFVLLLSSYMCTSEITDGKPNIVLHYNETKGGTDCFDQLCHAYSVARRTLRWPMRIFFGMLDQAVVNSRILLNCQKLKEGQNLITAINCLQSLHMHLVTPHLQNRMSRETFHWLLIIIGPQLENKSNPNNLQTPDRLPVNLETQLLMALWTLATPDSYR